MGPRRRGTRQARAAEHEPAHDAVERIVGREFEEFSEVGATEFGPVADVLSGAFEHRPAHVGAHHLVPPVDQPPGVDSAPTAGVEDPPSLDLGDEVGRPREREVGVVRVRLDVLDVPLGQFVVRRLREGSSSEGRPGPVSPRGVRRPDSATAAPTLARSVTVH